MSNYKRNNKWHCVKSGEVRLPLLLTLTHSLTHSLILQKRGFTSNYTGSSGHKNDSNDTFHSQQFTVPKFANRKPCPVLWYPTICLLTWYQMISWSLTLKKCHGDINLDEVLEVKDKACRLWLRWRTTFTTTPPNNNIGQSNTGKLNGYLGIKSTAMLLWLTERWTLSRRIRSEIIGVVCLLALFFSRATR